MLDRKKESTTRTGALLKLCIIKPAFQAGDVSLIEVEKNLLFKTHDPSVLFIYLFFLPCHIIKGHGVPRFQCHTSPVFLQIQVNGLYGNQIPDSISVG